MLDYIAQIPALVKAFLLASLTAYTRLHLREHDLGYIQVLAEGLFCGFVASGLFYGCRSIGMNEDLGVFLGACVGCIGSKSIRALAEKWADKKIGTK